MVTAVSTSTKQVNHIRILDKAVTLFNMLYAVGKFRPVHLEKDSYFLGTPSVPYAFL